MMVGLLQNEAVGLQREFCREPAAEQADRLVNLLAYWRRGLLSDEEMLVRWHRCALPPTERLRQLMELLVAPDDN